MNTNSCLTPPEIYDDVGFIIGESESIRNVVATALQVADRDAPVLIQGPSGSGKELIARLIHFSSTRRAHPFYPINCSAINESIAESEFFGHRRGAFTGAFDEQQGIFEAAGGGTLLLDEIGDMPTSIQSKILRAIEDKKIRKIGAHKQVPVLARLICSTNQDIPHLLKEKRFRSDLFYRINTVTIQIPPLQERRDDIRPLVEHYCSHFSAKLGRQDMRIDAGVFSKLARYDFPGNVRELKNMIERAYTLFDGSTVMPEHIMLQQHAPGEHEHAFTPDTYDLEAIERSVIQAALQKARYSQKRAAHLLKISRYTLVRKMRKHAILAKPPGQ
ncbi:MAG: sigma-54-dependent Fis family transcriptional regulator [Spirochaetes bacterium]|nr:sigma-54-dependent Fis family transcriptional regulator [Spirochaetota bacterium]